jgi:hypothetical protein
MSSSGAPRPWPALLQEDTEDEGRSVENFYAHLTLSDLMGSPEEIIAELAASLPLSESTRAHLLSQDPARLMVYRQLARNTLRGAVTLALPRASARLGERFEGLFSTFLAQRSTESHFLRDVTRDFLSFCAEADTRDVPPYIWELAELEATRIFVAAAPNTEDIPAFELDLARGLLFVEATRVLNFRHAVHKLSEDEEDRSVPDEKPTHLLSYRDPNNEVRYLELSALAALVVTRLLNGAALGSAIQGACEESGEALSADVLADCAQVLSDLAERGALMGASSL